MTTGMPQDPDLGLFRGRNGQVGGMGRRPFKCAAATLCLPLRQSSKITEMPLWYQPPALSKTIQQLVSGDSLSIQHELGQSLRWQILVQTMWARFLKKHGFWMMGVIHPMNHLLIYIVPLKGWLQGELKPPLQRTLKGRPGRRDFPKWILRA